MSTFLFVLHDNQTAEGRLQSYSYYLWIAVRHKPFHKNLTNLSH